MSEQPAESAPPAPGSPARQSSLWLAALGIGVLVVGGLMIANAWRGRLVTSPQPLERDFAEEARNDLQRRNYRQLSGALESLLSDPTYQSVPTQTHSLLGQPAPDFTLLDTEQKPWKLSAALADGPVVLVFYYGYHCDHCVSQLFGLHKDIDKFREVGARVVAVSADPPELTRERYAKYGAFAFPVLADPGNKVAEHYGTYAPGPKGDEGNLMHGTFVIDRQGRVIWTNRGDGPFTENRTLLLEVRRSERTARGS